MVSALECSFHSLILSKIPAVTNPSGWWIICLSLVFHADLISFLWWMPWFKKMPARILGGQCSRAVKDAVPLWKVAWTFPAEGFFKWNFLVVPAQAIHRMQNCICSLRSRAEHTTPCGKNACVVAGGWADPVRELSLDLQHAVRHPEPDWGCRCAAAGGHARGGLADGRGRGDAAPQAPGLPHCRAGAAAQLQHHCQQPVQSECTESHCLCCSLFTVPYMFQPSFGLWARGPPLGEDFWL